MFTKKSIYPNIVKPYNDLLIRKLNEFVNIKSVYDEKTISKKNPFGEGVSKALNWFYNLAKDDGFEVTNYDNKVVEMLVGKGKKNLTIMAHADVVPEGSGWLNNPYVVNEHKGILYGRGVADDKGPLLACYYAIKALKENDKLGDYQIRFLVGGNEECGSLCMEHYFKTLKKPQPTYGFSPDSSFPIIYGEKGIFNFTVSKEINIPGLISLSGGVAANSVIEQCVVNIEIQDDLIYYVQKHYPSADISTVDDVVTITFKGIAAHGSTPELGKNAGMMAIHFLANYLRNEDLLKLYEKFSNVFGEGLEANATSIDMGNNSLNVGLIEINNNQLNMVVNFRFVNNCDPKVIKANIRKNARPFSVTFSETSPLLYFDKNSKFIKVLSKAYFDETNDKKNKPSTTGGGTYAKEAKNIVAFGMEFPGFDPKMHSANERIRKKDLFLGMAIYARAIVELGKLIEYENKI